MDSFLDRLKQSGKSVKFAVAAANIGLVLIATGIHAAIIKMAEVFKPNPIPHIRASEERQVIIGSYSVRLLR